MTDAPNSYEEPSPDSLLSLGDVKDTQAIPLLIKILTSTHDPARRNAAAFSLRALAAQEALPHLVMLIEDHKNQDNRGTLIYALQTLDCSTIWPKFIDWAKDGAWEVCQESLRALAETLPRLTGVNKEKVRHSLQTAIASESPNKETLLLFLESELK